MSDSFVFSSMTPALQAYFDHQKDFRRQIDQSWRESVAPVNQAWDDGGRPDSGPLHDALNKAREEHYAKVETLRKVGDALRVLIEPGLLSQYHKDHLKWLCDYGVLQGEPEENESPTGKYRLVVTYHDTGPGTWMVSRGRVFRGEQEVAVIDRNYSSFPYDFCEGHLEGHDYLICGQDYQGFTVVGLNNGTVHDYVPSEARLGAGFCAAHLSVSPSKRTLAVTGCYWGGEYQVWFFDFSKPTELPWPLLAKSGSCEEDFFGWVGPDEASIGMTEEYYLPRNVSVYSATEEELRDADAAIEAGDPESKWYGGVRTTVTWKRQD